VTVIGDADERPGCPAFVDGLLGGPRGERVADQVHRSGEAGVLQGREQTIVGASGTDVHDGGDTMDARGRRGSDRGHDVDHARAHRSQTCQRVHPDVTIGESLGEREA
jgi:hypothetical protein